MLLVYFFLNVLTLFIGDERVVGELIKYPLDRGSSYETWITLPPRA